MTDPKEVLEHLEAEKAAKAAKRDAINPEHYKDGWSDGAELISITENLTSSGGQAVQYIARATRLDTSKNKGKNSLEWIQDLEKAKWFLDREIKRLRGKTSMPVKPVLLGEQAYTINVGPNAVDYMRAMAATKHPRAFA
ncbi:hypothetical protein SEA_GUUELAD_94 [Mycobacterium phage GuuelaD]|uniref:Uncharacterized protein n=1 Tax=Mycobacterium phage GuuelaD TaxID=2015819 RepID=A0A286MQK3_9CAUD|nr:nucleotide kinase [Mycobacterium phage GuuelaD]ASW31528.1 hypothetical protein SEA_GUUELAD_94 [Mycobacterium phage GuuelaD]